MKRNLKNGFTLIELLVVIAIIGILVTAGLASFSTAREQARDARRVEDMHNIQTSLEQYFAENGLYPNPRNAAFSGGTEPTDPLNSGTYVYNWSFYGPEMVGTPEQAYCICAPTESKPGNADTPTGTTCDWNTGGTGTHYCVQNQQ